MLGRPAPLSMESLRPETLEQMIGLSAITERLRAIAEAVRNRRMVPPNFLFYGPPGVGKTTAARAFGRATLGEEWENGFHQLDAADDRSAELVRRQIFPKTMLPPSRGAPCRIIFLDEADSLEPEAQSALRPALESPAASTSFILSCNEPDRLSPAIRSRCQAFRFSPLAEEELVLLARAALARTPFYVEEARLREIARAAQGIPRDAVRLVLEAGATAPVRIG